MKKILLLQIIHVRKNIFVAIVFLQRILLLSQAKRSGMSRIVDDYSADVAIGRNAYSRVHDYPTIVQYKQVCMCIRHRLISFLVKKPV